MKKGEKERRKSSKRGAGQRQKRITAEGQRRGGLEEGATEGQGNSRGEAGKDEKRKEWVEQGRREERRKEGVGERSITCTKLSLSPAKLLISVHFTMLVINCTAEVRCERYCNNDPTGIITFSPPPSLILSTSSLPFRS